MEKAEKMLQQQPTQPENSSSLERTPPQTQTLQRGLESHGFGNEIHKPITPNALKVPKSFKYSERYMSPIDRLMSPISRGLMARNRKVGPLLPPAKNPPKLLDDQCLQEVGLSPV